MPGEKSPYPKGVISHALWGNDRPKTILAITGINEIIYKIRHHRKTKRLK